MRTPEEIAERIKAVIGDDFLGYEVADLVAHLTPELARPFLKPGVPFEQQPLTEEGVKGFIRDYLPFAIEKAESHRGISALRSVSHMRAWFWLLGDDEMVALIDDDANYPQYGMPILKRAADRVGHPWPEGNEALDRMARGETCCESCEEGCGQ